MKHKKRKIGFLHIFRRVVQLLAFWLFPGMFTTVFYSVRTIISAAARQGTAPETLTRALLITAAVFLTTLLLGRFFCGFLCSFGAMEDLLWFISKKTLHLKRRMPERADAVLKWVKYVLLLIAVISWILQYELAGSSANPWNVFGRYTSLSGWAEPQYLISTGGILLLLIMLASFFTERFFCRYLCPLGALLALAAKFRPYRLKKSRSACGSCRLCTAGCAMGIPLYQTDRVNSGECIQCFQCMEICPRGNVTVRPAPAAAAAVSVTAAAGMICLGTIPRPQAARSGRKVSERSRRHRAATKTVPIRVSEKVSGVKWKPLLKYRAAVLQRSPFFPMPMIRNISWMRRIQ